MSLMLVHNSETELCNFGDLCITTNISILMHASQLNTCRWHTKTCTYCYNIIVINFIDMTYYTACCAGPGTSLRLHFKNKIQRG